MSEKRDTPIARLIADIKREAGNSTNDEYKAGLEYAVHYAELKLHEERQEIIDAVNATDEKCVSHANIAIRNLTKQTGNLFDHSGEDGEKYYNENFKID